MLLALLLLEQVDCGLVFLMFLHPRITTPLNFSGLYKTEVTLL